VHEDNAGERPATIVVPLDGSVEATAALPVARTLAHAEHAPLHLLHVGARGPDNTADMLQAVGIGPEEMRNAVLHSREGAPAEAIVTHARETAARLIVMASRAHEDTGRGALGAVTREVLRHAQCPVVLVSPERPRTPWPLRAILLPHDGIPTTAAAIARTTDLAHKAGAKVSVLHIASTTSAPPGEPGALMAPQYLDQPQYEWPLWAREFMERIVALGGPPPGVSMRLFFDCGEPADAIVRFAGEHETDLVVIAWVAGWEPEQRTTMRKVIDEAPSPLMIFPLEEPTAGQLF
jgi:nucleotide-binding universal stress UspA family protein